MAYGIELERMIYWINGADKFKQLTNLFQGILNTDKVVCVYDGSLNRDNIYDLRECKQKMIDYLDKDKIETGYIQGVEFNFGGDGGFSDYDSVKEFLKNYWDFFINLSEYNTTCGIHLHVSTKNEIPVNILVNSVSHLLHPGCVFYEMLKRFVSQERRDINKFCCMNQYEWDYDSSSNLPSVFRYNRGINSMELRVFGADLKWEEVYFCLILWDFICFSLDSSIGRKGFSIHDEYTIRMIMKNIFSMGEFNQAEREVIQKRLFPQVEVKNAA